MSETDPLIIKILWGLIASSLIGVVLAIGAQVAKGKADALSNGKALGYFVFMIIMVVWYTGLIWYWFSLLAQVE